MKTKSKFNLFLLIITSFLLLCTTFKGYAQESEKIYLPDDTEASITKIVFFDNKISLTLSQNKNDNQNKTFIKYYHFNREALEKLATKLANGDQSLFEKYNLDQVKNLESVLKDIQNKNKQDYSDLLDLLKSKNQGVYPSVSEDTSIIFDVYNAEFSGSDTTRSIRVLGSTLATLTDYSEKEFKLDGVTYKLSE